MYIPKIGSAKVLIDSGLFLFLKTGLRSLNGRLLKVYSYRGLTINYKNISCDVSAIINMVAIA